MAQKTYRSSFVKGAGLGLSLLFNALAGCGADGGDLGDEMFGPPPSGDGGFSSDASAATTGDGSLPPTGTNDGGVPAQPDSGSSLPADGGASAPDSATTTPDANAPDASAPDAGPVMRPDQGMGDGKDVITIGDSWMNLMANVGIENSLERVSKRDYRNFGVSGTRLLTGAIPGTYTDAKTGGPIKTVIMTGGGNDILQDLNLGILGGCSDTNIDTDPAMACKKRIDEVAARLTSFWAEMSKDGVQDVVVVGYTAKAMLLSNVFKKSIAYSNAKIPPLCAAVPAPLRCWTVDSDVEVPNLMLRDGIHPDDAGYDAIGAAVWKLMQAQGMRR